jgi:hypothetical protein
VKYLEGANLQGYGLFAGGAYSGQTCSGIKVEHGNASNTNQNPRYAGKNPWMSGKNVIYQDVLPAP